MAHAIFFWGVNARLFINMDRHTMNREVVVNIDEFYKQFTTRIFSNRGDDFIDPPNIAMSILNQCPTYISDVSEIEQINRNLKSKRSNPILQEKLPRCSNFICFDCGDKYGKRQKELFTVHERVCACCGQIKPVTGVKGFGYPSFPMQ